MKGRKDIKKKGGIGNVRLEKMVREIEKEKNVEK